MICVQIEEKISSQVYTPGLCPLKSYCAIWKLNNEVRFLFYCVFLIATAACINPANARITPANR